MEIDGHPTEDMLLELERRGALRLDGGTAGPPEETLRFLQERLGDAAGMWVFLPRAAFDTGFDEPLA
jgi:hypothetical protein